MSTSTVTVTRGETIEVGHPETYRNGFPTVTVLTVTSEYDTETFLLAADGAVYRLCGRCDLDTAGTIPHHGNVFNGVCFECNGAGHGRSAGTIDTVGADHLRRAKARATAAAKREAKAKATDEANAAERAAWAAANPEAAAALAEVLASIPEGFYSVTGTDYDAAEEHAAYLARKDAEDVWGTFLVDLATQNAFGRALTEGQTNAIVPAFTKAQARIAAREAKVSESRYVGEIDGKVTVTGTVVVATTYETNYSYTPTTNMLLVIEGDGDDAGVTIKVAGTGATLWDHDRGDRVTVTGKVKDHAEREGVRQTVLTRAKVIAA